MTKYLITLSIGPVQDFIAAARKTRDLWLGSYVLSEISKAAAASFKQNNAELIFPAVTDKTDLQAESEFNVGNKILVLLDTQNPSSVLDKAKQAAKDRWGEIAKQSRQLADKKGIKITDAIWQQQVAEDDVLELFGVWVSYEDTEKNDYYKKRRNRLDKLLNARKNTREFIQNPVDGDGVPKSSLDGLRENVIDQFDKWSCRKAGLNDNEYLDCTGIVKRLGNKEEGIDRFTAISRLAIDPWLRGLSGEPDFTDIITCLKKLKKLGLCSTITGNKSEGKSIYSSLPFDGQLLYPFRLQAEKDRLEYEIERDGNDTEAINALQELNNLETAIEQQDLKNKNRAASPYMAILAADGDRMGELLDEMQTLDAHKEISATLSRFATSIPEHVRNYRGHCVYAGGDDVLALLPLDQAIACSKKLAEEFATIMGDVKGIPKDKIPSLSVGLGISHFMTPMGKQLDLARKAEALAKSNELPEAIRKNALAIIIQPRSGAEICFRERWDNPQPAEKLLNNWIECHTNQLIPRRAGYNLREESFAIKNWCDQEDATHQKLIRKETRRILERKRDKEDNPIKEKWIAAVCERAASKGLAQAANELILTRRFAEALLLATNNQNDQTREEK